MSTGPQDASRVEQVPTCFRHPDRTTYVRCQRCNRPACPECMRDAAVGFQCVECVRAAGRTSRPARTISGAPMRAAASAVATWTLVAINIVLFLGEELNQSLVTRLGLIPAEVASGRWWQLLTSAFLHVPNSWVHITFNMWALIVLGPQLEQALGRLRYLGVYLLSALGGSALAYVIEPAGSVSIGASGAIFGLFGAVFLVGRRLRLDTRWILLVIVLNLVFSFMVPGIGWGAHIGGLVVGLLLTLAYVYAPVRRRMAIQLGATLGVCAMVLIVIVVRTLILRGTL